MKISFPYFGSYKYIEIIGNSRFSAISQKDGAIKIEAGLGIQFIRIWVDEFEVLNEFPSYARPDVWSFPIE